jgi:two-component system sensor histidine kinase AgrC
MDYLMSFIDILFAIILYIIIFLNIGKFKISKTEFVIAALVISVCFEGLYVVLPDVLWQFVSAMGIICTIAILTVVAYRKTKILSISIFYSVATPVIVMFSSNLATHILYTSGLIPPLDGYVTLQSDLIIAIINMFSIYIIAIPISHFAGKLLKSKVDSLSATMQNKFAVYMLGSTSITLVLFFIHTFLHFVIFDDVLMRTIYMLPLMAYLVFLVFSISAFADNFQKEAEARQKEEMITNLHEYASSVENMSVEMRRFRHDHINLLRGLQSYIEHNNMDGVRAFYERYVAGFTVNEEAFSSTLDQLKNIHIPELKSILSSKIIFAQEIGISVHVEVSGRIENLRVDIIDLCRMAGILLDNSIEACGEAKDAGLPAVLKLAAIVEDGQASLIFMNSCISPPPIARMFEKGFTTKGDGRGLGLSTVQSILDRSDYVKLNSYMEGEFFVQELVVV